ncbi:hypothetical protein GCM10027564_27920 [Luteimonas notoginsengisoli]
MGAARGSARAWRIPVKDAASVGACPSDSVKTTGEAPRNKNRQHRLRGGACRTGGENVGPFFSVARRAG